MCTTRLGRRATEVTWPACCWSTTSCSTGAVGLGRGAAEGPSACQATLFFDPPRPTRTTDVCAGGARSSRGSGGDAAEQRLDRSAHFLLHQVADHRQQALLSRHRVLLAGGRYTNVRSP